MNLPRSSVHLPDASVALVLAEAWRNGPALATLFLTFVAVALLGLLALADGSSGLSSMSWSVLAIAVTYVGITAAGSQFAEQANGRAVSSVPRAIAATPAIVLRAVVLAGGLTLVFAAFLLFVSAVLLACRLPVVGPVLYVVALPMLTIAGAVLLLASSAAALLSMPALWEGHSLRTVLSQLGAIAAQRKLSACGNLLLGLGVAAVVASAAMAFVLAGFGLSAGLSAPLSGAVSLRDLLAAWTGEARIVGANPYATAGAIAAVLVVSITAALLAAVFQFGLTLAYLRSTDGIDIAAARAALGRAIVEIQVRKQQVAEDIRAHARQWRPVLHRAPARATAPAVESASADTLPQLAAPTFTASPPLVCPRCDSPAVNGDLFCGNCGQPLSG